MYRQAQEWLGNELATTCTGVGILRLKDWPKSFKKVFCKCTKGCAARSCGKAGPKCAAIYAACKDYCITGRANTIFCTVGLR